MTAPGSITHEMQRWYAIGQRISRCSTTDAAVFNTLASDQPIETVEWVEAALGLIEFARTLTTPVDRAFTGRPMECAHCGHTIDEHGLDLLDPCTLCGCDDYDH